MENKTDTFFKKNIEYGTSKFNNETFKVNKDFFMQNSESIISTISIQTTKINHNKDESANEYKLNLHKLQDFYSKNDKNKIISVNLEIIKQII